MADRRMDCVRLVTGIVTDTVTGTDAVFPFVVVAITVVVPFAMGVTIPDADTDATEGVLLVQVIDLSVVFAGRIVAES